MKTVVTSVMVDDQEKALKFYTEVLRFVKKTDIPAGGRPAADRGVAGPARRTPTAATWPVTIAMFDDRCGNLMQIAQQ